MMLSLASKTLNLNGFEIGEKSSRVQGGYGMR